MVQNVPAEMDTETPYGVFNFQVAIEVKDLKSASMAQLCKGSFSEVSGLEATMEAKAIRSGGRNHGMIQRPGPVNFSTVVLKRGMASSRDLWKWWSLFSATPKYSKEATRCNIRITLQDSQQKPVVVWTLENAMPVKFKAGDLSAKGNDAAIEELHFVHEGLTIEPEGAKQ
jgi:phage tail-like protein